MKDLSTIKALWRQPDTLSLWGIPYEMRADVNQSPNDLWKAEVSGIRINTQDWVWLGCPGWWGSMPRSEIEQVKNWLVDHWDRIPQGPCEWTCLADEGEAP